MAKYDVDLRDYWRVIKKRKMIIVLMVILAGVSSYGFAKLKEPVPLYQSNAVIKIEQSANLISVLTGGFWYQTENMETHAFIIKSFPVLALTAQEVGWIPDDLSPDEIRMSQSAMTALERLKGMVSAEHQKGTNIVEITVTSNNPQEAARIANAVAAAYRLHNIQEKNRKTIETKKFIEEQLASTHASLKQAERDLQAFKEGYGLIALDAQTQNILDRLYTAEDEFIRTREKRREIASKLKVLKKVETGSIDRLEESMFTVTADSPVKDLRSRLSSLLLERRNLLIHLTERHPQVLEIDEKVEAVIQEMRKELGSELRTLKRKELALSRKLKQLREENQSLPQKATQLVRLERELQLQENLYSQLKAKHQETLIQESGQIEEVSVVRPAVVPARPFNIPSKFMIVVTGLVMGLIIGMVLAFGAEVFDTSMGTIEDVEESLQVPVLGVIPFLGREDRHKPDAQSPDSERARDLIAHYDPNSLAAEAFRSLRTNLQFTGLEIKGKTFLITSSFVQEGKTLNVINLALSVAQAGDKVLLVEADLRKPQIYKNFGLQKAPGLTDFVLGNYEWKEIVNNIADVMLGEFEIDDILKTPGLDNLNIMSAGTRPPNPTEILTSERFHNFLKEAAAEYDYVFIDAPPILPVADATEIAPRVDGTILVYTVGRIARGVLKRAKSTLDNIDARVLGVILNNVKPEMGPDYFRYHTQHYYLPDGDIKKRPLVEGRIKGLIQKFSLKGKRGLLWVVVLAVILLLVGIFWNDLFLNTYN
jgi:capsular exopolysaccharide synthesis family protein